MRTPGNDIELAAGFLISEGLIGRLRDRSGQLLRGLGCPGCARPVGDLAGGAEAGRPGTPNAVTRRDSPATGGLPRETTAAGISWRPASCGVCGKTTLDEVGATTCLPSGSPRRSPRRVHASPCSPPTCCAKPSGPSTAPAGSMPPACSIRGDALWCAREDVGRHNAVDKIIGFTTLATDHPASRRTWRSRPPRHSGRMGLDGVGTGQFRDRPESGFGRDWHDRRGIGSVQPAPSWAADRLGVALTRPSCSGATVNIYSHPERIRLPVPSRRTLTNPPRTGQLRLMPFADYRRSPRSTS